MNTFLSLYYRLQLRLFPRCSTIWIQTQDINGIRATLLYGQLADRELVLNFLTNRNFEKFQAELLLLAFDDFPTIARKAIELLKRLEPVRKVVIAIDKAETYLDFRNGRRSAFLKQPTLLIDKNQMHKLRVAKKELLRVRRP